ncbi:GntR family transcriptional regulator [Alkalihalobacillus oceani]|uniref:GntR family transcriptional regulator n=1 Tax=Halalkalibacter oceani TaxID=1653776 RepID=UPI00203F5A84|nr:GntR family transcriptional regulator [Halalkalibacter oceani]MCM3759361.1 GntR family transcriptional regulator [Halalkalibacter oceani]
MRFEEMIKQANLKTRNIKSLRDVALEFLREAIFSGHCKPGDHLKERELSQMLGISTTPVKEALRVLSYEGLVVTVPRKGTYVSELVDTSIEEFMMLKAILEGLASRLAALKITEDELKELEAQVAIMKQLTEAKEAERLLKVNFNFHMKIREAAKNPILLQTVNNVRAFDNAFRKRALKHDSEVAEGFSEHYDIYQAIKERDPDAAEEVMKKHIMRTAANVLKQKDNCDST